MRDVNFKNTKRIAGAKKVFYRIPIIISMRKITIMTLNTALFFLLLSFACSHAGRAQQPNLVFIIADDCTFNDIGCYGGQAQTPHIDRLAAEGMQMMKCFQAAPMCSPTRHNIYTGLYPVASGAYPNHAYAREGVKSIVHYLEPLGYRVALSGKTHIAPEEIFPFEYSGDTESNIDMKAVDQLFSEASNNGGPFCLFACSKEPHRPWDKGDPSLYPASKLKLPQNWIDTPETRKDYGKYLAEITYFDGQVGQIVDLLEKYNLSESTLFMVVSEQGSAFPFNKYTLYDNGVRSAMLVRWPGKIKPGSTSEALVEYVDIAPTFIEAAGGKPAAILQGKSLLQVLTGKKTSHKEYVYGIQTTRGINNGSDFYPIRSIRSDKYKLILNLAPEMEFKCAVSGNNAFRSWLELAEKGDKRAVELTRRYRYRPPVELYDVQADPLEMNNLAGDQRYASIMDDLKKRLEKWMKSQGDEGMKTEMEALDHHRSALKEK